ncbi:MAG: peptidase, partial [Clostridia bacterium]|nr:peptidase [Clostridia bacterium]
MEWISLAVIGLIVIVLIITNVRIVPQSYAIIIERLGAYHATWHTGMHLKIPFIDRIVKQVLLKEQVMDFAPQPVITKDNVTMQI